MELTSSIQNLYRIFFMKTYQQGNIIYDNDIQYEILQYFNLNQYLIEKLDTSKLSLKKQFN